MPIQSLEDSIIALIKEHSATTEQVEKVLNGTLVRHKQEVEQLVQLQNQSSTKEKLVIIDRRADNKEVKIETDGLHPASSEVLAMWNCDIPCYIYGPSGSGKTRGMAELAKILNVPYFRRAVGRQMTETGLMGYQSPHNDEYVKSILFEGYIQPSVTVVDEIDAGNSNCCLVINQMLDGDECYFPGKGMVKRHPEARFAVLANTIGNGADLEYVGRNPLDKAFLNRFGFVFWDYDEAWERTIALANYKAFGGTDEGLANKRIDQFFLLRKAIEELKISHILASRTLFFFIRGIAKEIDTKQLERTLIWRGLDEGSVLKIITKAKDLEVQNRPSVRDNTKDKSLIDLATF